MFFTERPLRIFFSLIVALKEKENILLNWVRATSSDTSSKRPVSAEFNEKTFNNNAKKRRKDVWEKYIKNPTFFALWICKSQFLWCFEYKKLIIVTGVKHSIHNIHVHNICGLLWTVFSPVARENYINFVILVLQRTY